MILFHSANRTNFTEVERRERRRLFLHALAIPGQWVTAPGRRFNTVVPAAMTRLARRGYLQINGANAKAMYQDATETDCLSGSTTGATLHRQPNG
jgi:hypothetical protein